MRSVRVLVAIASLAIVAGNVPAAAAAGTMINSLTVSGSPFYPNGDGVREAVTLAIRLSRPAVVSVEIVDFDGAVLRHLQPAQARGAGVTQVAWRGRDDDGNRVADGPYRFHVEASASGIVETGEAAVTKAAKPIYPARPAAIVVAVDPGHGDVYSEVGRVTSDGTREAVINLDIGLRLNAMLLGAGIRTVISRTTDQGANAPEWDRNEDGLIDYADELQARCDFASLARADVFVSIHNNFADNTGVGGPSTYYWPDRPFSDRSFALAKLVQANMLARLDLYRTDTWYPSRSHGVLTYPYFVLHEATPPRHPRATLMPGTLSEGMFLTKPYELSLLKQPRVRQSMAAAYYDAIQAYIAGRSVAVGYTVMGASTEASASGQISYQLRLVNKGMASATGWKLEARYVPTATLYDGSGVGGQLLGSWPVPPLARAARATVTATMPAPPAGDWLVQFDVLATDGSRLSDAGSPTLQLQLRVTAAP